MAVPASRANPGVRLHCIGRLQSNKAEEVREAVRRHPFDRPASHSSMRWSRKLDKADRFPTVYVQVNIGEEEQKGGCAIAEVGELVDAVRASPLPLAGLMAIPPLGVEPGPFFALLAKLARGQRRDGSQHGHVGRLQACGDDGRDGGPDRNRLVRRLRAARLCPMRWLLGSCTDPRPRPPPAAQLLFAGGQWVALDRGGTCEAASRSLADRAEGQGAGAGRIRLRRERGKARTVLRGD